MIAHRSGRTIFRIVAAFAVALQAAGCSGGGVTLAPAGRPTLAPASTATPGIGPGSGTGVAATGIVSGYVTLPAGAKIALSALTVHTSIGSAPVSASGRFAVEGFPNGHALATVLLANGDPVLMGFIGPNATTLDATSTATVLGFFGCEAFVLTPDVVAQAPALVAKTPGFGALTNAVATAIAASPDPFSAPSASVTSALSAFVAGVRAAATSAPASVVRHRDALTISPVGDSTGSGVNLIQEFPDGFHALNTFRRRAAAEVDRLSYVPSQGAAPVPDATRLTATPLPIPPVNGVNGGLLSTIDDIFANVFNGGNNPSAYAPVASASVPLPLVDGAASTTYQVTLLGPGGSPGVYSSLGAGDRSVQFQTVLYYYVIDLGIPFITTVLLPLEAEKIDTAIDTESGADIISELLTDGGTLVAQLQADLQPDANGHIDAQQAVTDTIRNLCENPAYTTTLQNAILKAVEEDVSPGTISVGEVESDLNHINKIIEGFDVGLSIFDTTIVAKDLGSSNEADRYTVTVVPDKLTLTPNTQTLAGVTTGTLTATDLTNTGSDAVPLQYTWTNTAHNGHITDGLAGHTDSFTSTKSTVTYTPTGTSTGTDTITVQIATLKGPNAPSQPIGAPLTATVTTEQPSVPVGKVVLQPSCFVFNSTQAQSQTLVATVNLPQGYSVSYYEWTIVYYENYFVSLDVPGSSVVTANSYDSVYDSPSNTATLSAQPAPAADAEWAVGVGVEVFYTPYNKQLAPPSAVESYGGNPDPAGLCNQQAIRTKASGDLPTRLGITIRQNGRHT
jgi:hypothetical protein